MKITITFLWMCFKIMMMMILLLLMMMMMLTNSHRPGHSHDRVCAWVNFSHCFLPQVSPSIPQCKTTICKFVGSVDLMRLPRCDELSTKTYKSRSRYTKNINQDQDIQNIFISGCGLSHLHTTSSLRFHLLEMFEIH